jgi:hypothetical protein
MKRIAIALAALFLMGNAIACCVAPTINIGAGSTLDVGPLQEKEESIPLDDVGSATIEILFGTGELAIAAGSSEQLFSGHFAYNVEQWEPEITYKDGGLTVQQGNSEDVWVWPSGDTPRNEWDLELSPEILLDLNIKAGAGEGELDLTGLQLEGLSMDLGAGDFAVRFDEPSETKISRFTVNTGAAKLEIAGIGNASPEEMIVRGGVGDVTVDLTGNWARSADIRVTAGVGALTLRLPADVGVRVDVEGGLSSVTASGLRKSGGGYVNDVYGEAKIELDVQVTTGVGEVNLEIAD